MISTEPRFLLPFFFSALLSSLWDRRILKAHSEIIIAFLSSRLPASHFLPQSKQTDGIPLFPPTKKKTAAELHRNTDAVRPAPQALRQPKPPACLPGVPVTHLYAVTSETTPTDSHQHERNATLLFSIQLSRSKQLNILFPVIIFRVKN